MSGEFSVGKDNPHADLVKQWKAAWVRADFKPEDTIGKEKELQVLVEALRGITSAQDIAVPFRRVRKTARGVLLTGRPGTGKSHLLRAACARLDVPVLVIQVTQLLGTVYGESGRRVIALLEAGQEVARESKGAALLIEEIDGLGSRYQGSSESTWFAMFLGTLFTAMDRAASQATGERLGILGATNRPEALDPALRSRLGCTIEIKPPNLDERLAYLETTLTEGKATGILQGDVDVMHLANLTDGWTLRDIAQALDEVNSAWISRSSESDHVTDAILKDVFRVKALRREPDSPVWPPEHVRGYA